MIQLSLGLLAFVLPHMWKRVSPGTRARFGAPGKGIVAVLSVGGIWLMARGFGAWDDAPQAWLPASWLRPLNNLLMLLAVYFFVASGMGAWGARVNRHPQLIAVILWAVAHLLVNGDAASILLFGGLLAWAVAEIGLIDRAAPDWTPPPSRGAGREVAAAAIALAVYGVLGYVHGLIGPWPWGA